MKRLRDLFKQLKTKNMLRWHFLNEFRVQNGEARGTVKKDII